MHAIFTFSLLPNEN